MFFILEKIPKKLISHWVGILMEIPLGAQPVKWFVDYYNINMAEAEKPLSEYKTVSDLFTRRLKPGARPLGGAPLIHPVDGEITQALVVEKDQIIQAKNHFFSLKDLLQSEGSDYKGGMAITYYLCPTDYHRVHSPLEGKVTAVTQVPGELWPVNSWSVNHIENLFGINERIIVHMETQWGPVALVMVGATNVGKMTLSFDERVVTNKDSEIKTIYYENPIELQKGQELGIFHMGSTVIMLYSPEVIKNLNLKIPSFGKVKMGEGF